MVYSGTNLEGNKLVNEKRDGDGGHCAKHLNNNNCDLDACSCFCDCGGGGDGGGGGGRGDAFKAISFSTLQILSTISSLYICLINSSL